MDISRKLINDILKQTEFLCDIYNLFSCEICNIRCWVTRWLPVSTLRSPVISWNQKPRSLPTSSRRSIVSSTCWTQWMKPFGEKAARCAITANNNISNQLLTFKDWVGHWQFQGVRSMSAIKCLWGLQTTIASIVCLSHELLSEGFRFICTARFNQDCLENFFAGIHSKQGWNKNPNAEQFGFAFRKAIVLSSLDSGIASVMMILLLSTMRTLLFQWQASWSFCQQ